MDNYIKIYHSINKTISFSRISRYWANGSWFTFFCNIDKAVDEEYMQTNKIGPYIPIPNEIYSWFNWDHQPDMEFDSAFNTLGH